MPERWDLLVHPGAIVDAREAREWYQARSPQAAEGFMAELDRAISQIIGGPHRWASHVHDTRRFLFRRYPYFVVYRVKGFTVHLVAVQHASRRPGYWKTRR